MMLRVGALLAVCSGFVAAAPTHASASSSEVAQSCDAAGACGQGEEMETTALLQSSPEFLTPAASHSGCSTRSLIIGQEVGVDTYLQYNAQLRASGADSAEFLNLTSEGDFVHFATDVEFVKYGCPVFGIVYVKIVGGGNLAKKDAAQLKAYLNAGGMLIIGESTEDEANVLLEDLGSSIRQKAPEESDYPCTTPENAPYVPGKTSAWCPLTRGVTGLQGSNLDEVIDPKGSSYPLFHLKSSPDFVVARAEKKRSLVVVGDDEPFDDDCATSDSNNRLAFGVTTNLRFFANLFQQRCAHKK